MTERVTAFTLQIVEAESDPTLAGGPFSGRMHPGLDAGALDLYKRIGDGAAGRSKWRG